MTPDWCRMARPTGERIGWDRLDVLCAFTVPGDLVRRNTARRVVLSSTMAFMESVTVSELNRQTARVLERVKAGESVEISEYGRPVARIMPAAPSTGVPLLDRLIADRKSVV